jgi:hypothetical protein
MFNWLKQYPDRWAFQRRYRRHYISAEGPPLHREVIAAAMTEMEDSQVKERQCRLAPSDQRLFLTAYGCFVMYWLLHGLEMVLDPEEVESAREALQRQFAKQAWFYPDAFARIWDKMQIFMPEAMKSYDDAPPFPVTELCLAVQAAGFVVGFSSVVLDAGFGVSIGFKIGYLVRLGRMSAEAHRKLVRAWVRSVVG